MAKKLFHLKKLLTKNLFRSHLKHFFGEHKTHLAALVAVSVFLGWMASAVIQSPLNAPKVIVIKEGEGAYAVADTLKKEGIIENKFVFIAYTFISGNEKKLQAGRYLFKPGVTVPGIVYSVSSGLAESDDIIVTIPEGFNVWEIDKRLAGLGLIIEGEFAKKYQPQEGEFFPDTYRFNKEGETVDTIAEKMKNHLNLKFKEISLTLNPLVLRDTLMMASILEKEARKEEDMRLVAGVIRNRLAKKMPLEIDATVSYGACLRKSQIITSLTCNNTSQTCNYKDCDVSQVAVGTEIKINSPYNSYKRAGLPPGPIANPGIQAIQAVLNPQASDYLYYLSTRDGSQIIFSKTAVEHAANRKKYLGI
ncbi:MAG: endolytic transglycosylase MltG [Patescibacteria group bacterium]